MPEEPKTVAEATALLCSEWLHAGDIPTDPDDLINHFHMRTCLPRYAIDAVRGCASDVDEDEVMKESAMQIARASRELIENLRAWLIYSRAVDLVGGADRAHEIRREARESEG